jgi:hypothetical protein
VLKYKDKKKRHITAESRQSAKITEIIARVNNNSNKLHVTAYCNTAR